MARAAASVSGAANLDGVGEALAKERGIRGLPRGGGRVSRVRRVDIDMKIGGFH